MQAAGSGAASILPFLRLAMFSFHRGLSAAVDF